MKVAVCFIYVLMSIIYLSPIADGGRTWGGINLITQLSFIGYLCFLAEGIKQNTEIERLFFSYLKFLSIGNCIYILWCILRGKYWSIYHTDIFAYILGIGFLVFLLHFAIKKS